MIIHFTKKTNNSESVLSASSNKYENFCDQDRQVGRPNMDGMPENMEPPEGMESPQNRDMPRGNFSDMRSIIEEFCEDGEIDDSEASQLDELFEDMPSGHSNNFNPKSN